MFCDKCGAQLPEGSQFCGQCGNSFAPVQQPVYQQPVYQQPVQQPVYQQPMPRDKFIDSTVPKKGLLVRVLLIACSLLIVISLCTALWGSILNSPVLKTVATLNDADVDDLEDELKDARRQLRDYEDRYDLSNEEEEILEAVEKLCETPSLMNMKKVIKMGADRDYSDAFGGMDSFDRDEAEMALALVNGLITYLVISFLIGLVFAALACWKRNTALMVFALLFSVGNCSLTIGALLGLVMLALYVVAIVMNVQLSNQYKAYKQSLGIYN